MADSTYPNPDVHDAGRYALKPSTVFCVLLGLYASQSIVGGIVQSSLPTILRDEGYSLGQIGLMSILTLPWALKIFWAPLVDRLGSLRSWLLVCQVSVGSLFAITAFLDTATATLVIVGLLVVLVVAAATQDIATDAIGIQTTQAGKRQIASGASSAGAYIGYMVGGGAWLWVYAKYGWSPAMLLVAATMIVLTLPVFLLNRAAKQDEAASGASLIRAVKSPLIRRGIVLLLLWSGAVRLGMSLGGAMLVDAGLELEQIALLRGMGGMVAGLVGSLLAMELMRRRCIGSALWITACFLILCFVAHAAWFAVGSLPISFLVVASLALSMAIGTSFVCIYAILMELCAPEQVATDFSVLQSFDILLLVVTGILSGLLAEHLGYLTVFLFASALMCVALPYARSLALQASKMSGQKQ